MASIQPVKNILKRILPPPTNSFMREVNFLKWDHTNLLDTLNRRDNELRKKLEQVAWQEQENLARLKALEKQLLVQNERLDRLNALFESANRENLRIYFDARAERDELAARYEAICEEMRAEAKERAAQYEAIYQQ